MRKIILSLSLFLFVSISFGNLGNGLFPERIAAAVSNSIGNNDNYSWGESIFIASYNSPDWMKNLADYVSTGGDDAPLFEAAYAQSLLYTETADIGAGVAIYPGIVIKLSPGIFNIATPIDIEGPTPFFLQGSGMGVTWPGSAFYPSGTVLFLADGANCTMLNNTFNGTWADGTGHAGGYCKDIYFYGNWAGNSSEVGAWAEPIVSVDTGTEVVTVATQRYSQGHKVQFTTTDTLPAGLSLATDYWLANMTTTSFKVYDNANLHAVDDLVDITDAGTGTHTVRLSDTNGIIIANKGDFRFEHCIFTHFAHDVTLWLDNHGCWFDDIDVEDNRYTGINLTSFRIGGGGRYWLENVHFARNAAAATEVATLDIGAVESAWITNCDFEGGKGAQAVLVNQGASEIHITDCDFKDSGSASTQDGIYLLAPAHANGCNFTNLTGYPIELHTGADESIITGNTFQNWDNSAIFMSATWYLSDAVISNNVFDGIDVASANGIYFDLAIPAALTNTNITNNTFKRIDGTAILLGDSNEFWDGSIVTCNINNNTGEDNEITEGKVHVTVTGIDATAAATTTLYTVPTGYTFYPTTIVITITGGTYDGGETAAVASFGGNSDTYDDWLNTQTYTFTAATGQFIADAPTGAVVTQTAADVFKLSVETGSGDENEVWTVEVFGYIK